MMETMGKKIRRIAIILVWIALWQLAAGAIHNKIIFVGPLEVAAALYARIGALDFWGSILYSFVRIALGFLGAFLAGILLAGVSGRFFLLREFLEPLVGLLQSVPVASFVILALIWIGSANLSILITFLVVFPVIYRNVLEGLGQVDPKMLEMARVFGMRPWKKLLYLYRPALFPYLLAGCKISLGMAWKSGVAAEVIGVPAHSIGEKLYMAKIYLSTADLFAWTLVIILVSRLFEWLFLHLLELAVRDLKAADTEASEVAASETAEPEAMGHGMAAPELAKARGNRTSAGKPARTPASPVLLRLEHIEKSYAGRTVLHDLTLDVQPGGVYCLFGPSGIGKTTLLRLIMGLEKPDSGDRSEADPMRISAVFQEDRLCEFLDGVKNIRIACGSAPLILDPEELLGQLLEPEALGRPVARLSGGMRRRVAIARALAVSSQMILMDEPFAGLDDAARERAVSVIRQNLLGRTLILVSHQEEDAVRLNAKVIRISGKGRFLPPDAEQGGA